jgi:hypothetical protein
VVGSGAATFLRAALLLSSRFSAAEETVFSKPTRGGRVVCCGMISFSLSGARTQQIDLKRMARYVGKHLLRACQDLDY